ncbi:hypothetical protein [Cohnella sp. GbtcB17]|uniref:hypothetical protein n=1 Tax=Cohnella sp. GbtcB17 TaxID=2824762 RepID=UPI001C2F387C|nr:hypothetical protein [Cohnella sp. GbtcB17]
MRKHQQQRIFELLLTLKEAHDELERQKEPNIIVGLLGDCQEFAVNIGEYIEGIEGEGTATVSLLEAYCELLYEVSLSLDLANGIPKLNGQLTVIANRAKNELKPNKIEVAFFPYKASMFDALESIWLAAKDDPNCDVYVVPIPYYDKLPDGELGEMHYEGDQYPDYVPITNWLEYDVEARRPDIIYIHNPYDVGNRVTSVHPMYYSKRLRDLTDLLVYVPYFVSNGDVSEAMCSTMACIYADKVFVQSEKVRQTYIRVYKRLAQEHGFGDTFGKAEEKFIALGSPKFDKVVNSRREDYPLPEEWAAKIVRSDGTRKKVVLYNTTITSLLEGNDTVLRKLRYVFGVFRERDDVLLWWRPHPLNGTTYASMRPELLEEYEAIVQEYKLAGFGIYDDSADSQRAISMSDAYYGDGGSLMGLYSLTGKPMMWQNVELDSDTPTHNPYVFTHAADDGECLWWSAFSGNALMRMDKQTKVATYVGTFPEERYSGWWLLYTGVILTEGKLFFAPGAADKIAVYDIEAGTWDKVAFESSSVRETERMHHPESKFADVIRYNQYLFFIPTYYPAIIRYDLLTGKVEHFNKWIEQLETHILDIEDVWFVHSAQEGSELLLPACNANAIIIFDMETCTSIVQPVENVKHGFSGICYDGERYWITPRKNGGITQWNRKDNSFAILTEFPQGYNEEAFPFTLPIYANGNVWLLPNHANLIIRMDTKDKKMMSVEEFPTHASPFYYTQWIEDKLVAVSYRENLLIEWDILEASIQEHAIVVPGECEMRMGGRGLFEDYNYESSATNLGKYCDFILTQDCQAVNVERQMKRIVREIANFEGYAGSAIYMQSVEAVQI